MNTRLTNRSRDGSWNGPFDRSSSRNNSFNSSQSSRSNYRGNNYSSNNDSYNRQNYHRDNSKNRGYQQHLKHEQRNQNYQNRYENNQDRNRFDNRRRPNKYQHHRNQHKAQVIFEFSDQNMMEMMQTVRGFRLHRQCMPTTSMTPREGQPRRLLQRGSRKCRHLQHRRVRSNNRHSIPNFCKQ